MTSRRAFFFTLLAVVAVLILAGPALAGVDDRAAPAEPASPLLQPTSPPEQKSISDAVCLDCHGDPGLSVTLESGEEWDLYVPQLEYFGSVHGEAGYACVQCHTTVGNFPHPEFNASNLREVTLQLYQLCERCHLNQSSLTQDSVHADALAAGVREAAVCTDCHTAHDVRRLTDQETGELRPDANEHVPLTCAQCHSAIYENYRESVHGSALIGEGNPDVPSCIDCHGVHSIEDPTTAAFRLRSPDICAGCHTDPEIMDKYGISTQVLSTYVADFHGTTVTLFQKEHPDQETNKPVCYDCHGVHDIRRTDDPQYGLQLRENLLERCQVCHPDATINFPAAWLSHYIPSPDRYPLVFTVDTFYQIFIPTVLGGMAVLVVLDLGRNLRERVRRRSGREEAITGLEVEAASEQAEKAKSPSEEGIVPKPEETEPPPEEEAARPEPTDGQKPEIDAESKEEKEEEESVDDESAS